MADYREISQIYAQKGIQAGMILNGGAAVALLNQAHSFSPKIIAWPMRVWAFGALFAAFCWVAAFVSARFVDKSEREVGFENSNLRKANIFMEAGLLLLILSLAAFIGGCLILSFSL